MNVVPEQSGNGTKNKLTDESRIKSVFLVYMRMGPCDQTVQEIGNVVLWEMRFGVCIIRGGRAIEFGKIPEVIGFYFSPGTEQFYECFKSFPVGPVPGDELKNIHLFGQIRI